MKLFVGHVSDRLAAYVQQGRDSDLVERHLSRCEPCRAECAQVRMGVAALEALPLIAPPESIWISIEAACHDPRKQPRFSRWKLAFAAAAAAALLGFGYFALPKPGPRWQVDDLGGAPILAGKHMGRVGRIGAGQWLETDSHSRARITVGDIGTVEIAPNSRARVIATLAREHRIALAHGQIHASISAPPKLFFVDTRSGTAVDLGCEYDLRAEEDGSGLMRVTRGWVSFEGNGRESLVPAGAMCRIHPRTGPGTPYFEDAAEGLKLAVDDFDETSRAESLTAILAAAHPRDTLSLWHLLSRVDKDVRERIYSRMVAFSPLPAGISKEKILALDPEALNRWKDELAWTW